MGAFPNLSRNVPFCPRLSSFVLLGARNEEKSGQKRTNGDKTGHLRTNWETPPFSIYPHLALLNYFPPKTRLALSQLPLTSPLVTCIADYWENQDVGACQQSLA